jgi:hypothetical protein
MTMGMYLHPHTSGAKPDKLPRPRKCKGTLAWTMSVQDRVRLDIREIYFGAATAAIAQSGYPTVAIGSLQPPESNSKCLAFEPLL